MARILSAVLVCLLLLPAGSRAELRRQRLTGDGDGKRVGLFRYFNDALRPLGGYASIACFRSKNVVRSYREGQTVERFVQDFCRKHGYEFTFRGDLLNIFQKPLPEKGTQRDIFAHSSLPMIAELGGKIGQASHSTGGFWLLPALPTPDWRASFGLIGWNPEGTDGGNNANYLLGGINWFLVRQRWSLYISLESSFLRMVRNGDPQGQLAMLSVGSWFVQLMDTPFSLHLRLSWELVSSTVLLGAGFVWFVF